MCRPSFTATTDRPSLCTRRCPAAEGAVGGREEEERCRSGGFEEEGGV